MEANANATPYVMILLSVVLSAAAQVALKAGMTSAPVRQALATGLGPSAILNVAFNPLVMLGLAFYVLSAAVWLGVLSKMPVSSAYPFVALAIVLTSVLGRLFFHDAFTLPKILGTLLIVSGVVVLAKG
jgi:multidrug transporter EmrE-like cation transporter